MTAFVETHSGSQQAREYCYFLNGFDYHVTDYIICSNSLPITDVRLT